MRNIVISLFISILGLSTQEAFAASPAPPADFGPYCSRHDYVNGVYMCVDFSNDFNTNYHNLAGEPSWSIIIAYDLHFDKNSSVIYNPDDKLIWSKRMLVNQTMPAKPPKDEYTGETMPGDDIAALWDKCLKIHFYHAANVVYWSKNSLGSFAQYCLVEPQGGQSNGCWQTGGQGKPSMVPFGPLSMELRAFSEGGEVPYLASCAHAFPQGLYYQIDGETKLHH